MNQSILTTIFKYILPNEINYIMRLKKYKFNPWIIYF